MGIKKKSLLTVFCTALISTSVYANIVIHTPYQGKNEDVCTGVAGSWTGSGTASDLIKCVYTGSMNLGYSSGKLNINDLLLTLDSSKSSGLCPKTEKLQLTGTCENGKIVIDTPGVANLDGDLSQDGMHSNLTGTVTFTVPIFGKISPSVVMTINKTTPSSSKTTS